MSKKREGCVLITESSFRPSCCPKVSIRVVLHCDWWNKVWTRRQYFLLLLLLICLGCAANWWYVLYVVVGLLILFAFVYVVYKLYWYCKGIRHARAYASKSKETCIFCYKQTILSYTAVANRESSHHSLDNIRTAAAWSRSELRYLWSLQSPESPLHNASVDNRAIQEDEPFRYVWASPHGSEAKSSLLCVSLKGRPLKPSRRGDWHERKFGCVDTAAGPAPQRASADFEFDKSEEALRSSLKGTQTGVGEIGREIVHQIPMSLL